MTCILSTLFIVTRINLYRNKFLFSCSIVSKTNGTGRCRIGWVKLNKCTIADFDVYNAVWLTGSITRSLLCLSARGHDVEKRALIFPPSSLYGTFLAIAVPIDIPDKNVFVSYNFEANYSTTNNITEIDEVLFPNLPVVSSRHSRSITRELAYTVLEARFKEHGMKGKECMLRNICEAAETPLHHNGLLGHIMHIVFTPSTSREEGLSDEYYEAEADGQRGDCDKYLDLCPFSVFDLVTRLVEIQH